MFLTESTKIYGGKSGISASPTTGWQMLYESEMAWHKLEMGMTRLEHSAIVNEDRGLLQEGVKEFFNKAKKWFQWAGQEFLRYLDKVIDTWVNIQNKIRTWLIDAESIKKKLDNGKTVTISVGQQKALEFGIKIAQHADAIRKVVDDLRDEADKHDADNEDFGSYSHDNFKENGRHEGSLAAKYLIRKAGLKPSDFPSADTANNTYGETPKLSKDELLRYLNFAKDGRIRCIKALQYARNSMAKLINSGIRAADSESDEVKSIKKASSKCREVLNSYISYVNRATNAVISALGKLRDNPKEGKFGSQVPNKLGGYFFD